jgi:hypothetical protein
MFSRLAAPFPFCNFKRNCTRYGTRIDCHWKSDGDVADSDIVFGLDTLHGDCDINLLEGHFGDGNLHRAV